MARQTEIVEWTEELSKRLPMLNRSLVQALALYSFGMVLAHSCGLTSVVFSLAPLVGRSTDALRQQLRELCYASADKAGRNRSQLDVSPCFGALLAWVIAWCVPSERRLALALDATTVDQRFTVLCSSVVYGGCAIPVAWKVLPGNQPDPWQPHWQQLLAALAGQVPSDWLVVVLADRGLYARWLFRQIVAQGWHPCLRIQARGHLAPHGQGYQPIRSLLPHVGSRWVGQVTCFSSAKARLSCTLLGYWDAACAEPWFVLTDLPPAEAATAWYGMRAWIERFFKGLKRAGWHWEQTKMSDPARAERLWLAIAVATLWCVARGARAEAEACLTPADEPHVAAQADRPRARRTRPRLLSLFRRGLLAILTDLLLARSPLRAYFPALPWPTFQALSP